MHVHRRSVVTGLLAATLCCPDLRAAASEEKGLFFSAAPPGKPATTLFGYTQIAAEIGADIIRDGDKYASVADRVVIDVPNVHTAARSTPMETLVPVSQRVSPKTFQRLRDALGQRMPTMPFEKIPTILLVTLLQGEGRTASKTTVGGTIAQYAFKAGKPISYLFSEQDVKRSYRAPDISALDRRVDENMICHLLDLRDRVGPIGKYEETLYLHRDTRSLESEFEEKRRLGILSPSDMMPLANLKDALLDRTVEAVQTAQNEAFIMLSIGSLTENGGVLARLSAQGAKVRLLA